MWLSQTALKGLTDDEINALRRQVFTTHQLAPMIRRELEKADPRSSLEWLYWIRALPEAELRACLHHPDEVLQESPPTRVPGIFEWCWRVICGKAGWYGSASLVIGGIAGVVGGFALMVWILTVMEGVMMGQQGMGQQARQALRGLLFLVLFVAVVAGVCALGPLAYWFGRKMDWVKVIVE
ncbi:MAG: hypothetical protein EA376_01960 [Phycisphaeraceae bacterium]|nr:MAG: hypothetical protein EA376_01960 [Phycisphaeraceae bacterium]